MGQTHPNAYLTEAASMREQAAQLLGSAEALEAKAAELGAELPKSVPASEPEKEDANEQSGDSVPAGPEDAVSVDEDDPHGRRNRRHR